MSRDRPTRGLRHARHYRPKNRNARQRERRAAQRHGLTIHAYREAKHRGQLHGR